MVLQTLAYIGFIMESYDFIDFYYRS